MDPLSSTTPLVADAVSARRVDTVTLTATDIGSANIVVPGVATFLGTVRLGAAAAASLDVAGELHAGATTLGQVSAHGPATFAAGAAVPAGQALTLTNARLVGEGVSRIDMRGDIASLTGTVSAPTGAFGALTVDSINGAAYPPAVGALPRHGAFDTVSAQTAVVCSGHGEFAGLRMARGDLEVEHDARIVGAVSAGTLGVAGALRADSATAATLAATKAVRAPLVEAAALVGVHTINGLPYPPAGATGSQLFGVGECRRGAFSPLVVPAQGGAQSFVLTLAAVAGAKNNALGRAGDTDWRTTAPRIDAIAGDGLVGLDAFAVVNDTPYIFVLPSDAWTHAPDSDGEAFWPGTRAVFSRTPGAARARVVRTERFALHAPPLAPLLPSALPFDTANCCVVHARVGFDLCGSSRSGALVALLGGTVELSLVKTAAAGAYVVGLPLPLGPGSLLWNALGDEFDAYRLAPRARLAYGYVRDLDVRARAPSHVVVDPRDPLGAAEPFDGAAAARHAVVGAGVAHPDARECSVVCYAERPLSEAAVARLFVRVDGTPRGTTFMVHASFRIAVDAHHYRETL